MKPILHIIRDFLLGCSCGLIYFVVEICYRGYSHWSMFVLAMFCGVFCIDHINNYMSFDLDFRAQVMISTGLCTLSEGLCGLYVNIYKGWNVWDYSNLPLTFFFGQCNVFFVFAWIVLCIIGIFYCDAMNYYIFKIDPCPYYKIGGKVFLRFPYRKQKGV